MEAIKAMAARLGRAIADSPQAKALREAGKQLDSQSDVKEMLEKFRQQSDKMARLQQENKPVEVEDKHALADLQDKLAGSEAFKKYTEAQMNYVDLMRTVQDELQKHLSQAEGEA